MVVHVLGTLLLLCLPGALTGSLLPVRTYTTADGLPSIRVSRIVRDARGFLWFCTHDGLSRFDGYQFTNFGIEQGLPPGADDLVTTDEGWYWVATHEGLVRFDTTGKGRLFTVYVPPDPDARWITALADDGAGGLWCGTSRGLYHFKRSAVPARGAKWNFAFVDIGMANETPDDRFVTVLLRDRNGEVWVGGYKGLYRGSAGDALWKRYTTRDGLPDVHVTSLLQARDGSLWVGTWNGLCRLSIREGADPLPIARYDRKRGPLAGVVGALLEASDGTLWIGTDNGLSKLSWNNGKAVFEQINGREGLNQNHLNDLAEDTAGNLWTAGSGVVEMIRGGFRRYGKEDGLDSNWISSILENQKGKLCVTTKGAAASSSRIHINCLDGQRFYSVTPNIPRKVKYWGWGGYQVTFQDRTAHWWVPTGEGLFRFPPISKTSALARVDPEMVLDVRRGLANNDVFRVFEDSRGDIWISTGDDVTHWQRADGRLRHYPRKGFLATAFLEDRGGSIWTGSSGGNLVRIRDGRFESIELPRSIGSIYSLFLDRDGCIWAGGSRGLLRIDSPGERIPRMTFISTADGLASNDIDGITQDVLGRMYVVTGRGVDCFYPTFPLRLTHYTTADGLIAGGLGGMAFCDRHGALWFGNGAGLMRLDPVADTPATPPPVTISELRIRGVWQALAALGEVELSGLELPADQNQLEIGFVGLEFRAGKKLTYQYRFESDDSDWSPATTERTVNFASLSPGSYRFIVRAVSSEGLVSEKPARLAFTMVPPLWQRWWARVLMLLVTGAALYALYRYRLEHLLVVERVRARIATDLHDDIGSTLSQISILSEVASREARERERAESLREIADLSRESVGSMSDIVWAIDPEQDRVEQLTHRMRHFAGDLSLGDGVEIRFAGLTDDHDLRLGADMRRQIFLIFKESLHNALRHSGGTHVDVEFALDGGWLKLSIQDNGRGFDAKRAVLGHGLVSIEQRARILGGEVEFVSAPDAGTRVQVKIPIKARRLRRWRKARTRG